MKGLAAMTILRRGVGLAVGVWALLMAGPVLMTPVMAQESLDQGKTPAQLFASDCGLCHKTPAGLSRVGGGPFGGLKSFLQEHYTASREAAAAIAAYVEATDKGPPPSAKHKSPAGKRTAKGDEKGKKDAIKKDEIKKNEKKTDEDKSDKKAGKKPDADKSGDSKSSDPKSEDKKPEDKKSDDKKPADAKTTAQPDKPKSVEAKPGEQKSDEKKTGDKPPDKPNDSN
jgi:hypothetical protein